TRAEGLLEFLVVWQRPLDDAVRKALSDPTRRAELREVFKRCQSFDWPAFNESWAFLTERLFDPSRNVSTGIILDEAPLDVLARWLADRAADAARLYEWRSEEHTSELQSRG